MMKKVVAVIGVIFLALTVFVINKLYHKPFSKGQPTDIEFSDPKQSIKVSPSNKTFKIILKSNPSTGFSWSVKKYDNNLIERIGHEFHSPAATKPQMIGAPGYEEWSFRVRPEFFRANGPAKITFIYQRPWEDQSVQKLTFNVETKNAN